MQTPKDSSHSILFSLLKINLFFLCINSTARLALPTLETFTMHSYWRTTGGAGGRAAAFFTGNTRLTANNTPIPAASHFSDYGFDGPFFDLEFSLEASETTETKSGSGESSESDEEDMREIELNFDVDDEDFEISHFNEGNLLPIPPPSSSIESNDSEDNSKSVVSLMKSAEKFRDLLLIKLKRQPNSSNGGEKSDKIRASDDDKVVRVKFKVDEVKGPLISLFARDINFSDDSTTNPANLGKETLQKYLNILKPLYLRVEKMRLHGGGGGDPNCGAAVSPPPAMVKSGVRNINNLQAVLKVVRKHLGKSRSTSAAAAVSPPGSNRRDDSLLEVQDGIQGAIQHCKRSFKSNREGESGVYSRSVSDSYSEKFVISSSSSHSAPAIEIGL